MKSKMGPKPKFKKRVQVTVSFEDEELELINFITENTSEFIRSAAVREAKVHKIKSAKSK
jgi:hypothetical protein